MAGRHTDGKQPKLEISEVTTQIEKLQAEIAALNRQIGHAEDLKLVQMSDHAKSKGNEGADKSYRASEAAPKPLDQSITKALEIVRTNPVAALGVAAGVGYLIGALSVEES